jgi:outer membrane protein OmpA-like peptidoglycan-associated protein
MMIPQLCVFLISFPHMRLKYLVLLCVIFSYVPAFSQAPLRAQQYFERALRAKAFREDDKATENMLNAIGEYHAFAEAYSMLGEWMVEKRRYPEAIQLFTTASKNCPNGNKIFAKPLAKSLLNNHDHKAALELINTYGTKNDKDWEKMRKQAGFVAQAMNKKLKDTIINSGYGINSPKAELFPCVSADTNVLYFTRQTNELDHDFFRATADSCGGWFYARNIGEPLNTNNQEFAQMISADGHYVFFTRCENRSENGWGQGGCDLYMAYSPDSVWSIPQSFGATINTPSYEGHGCLSPDNRQLFFASNRPGGYGGMDIWVSRFEDGVWHQPQNLGPQINTPGEEAAPFIHTDNKTLYFASDGHTGMGGTDLFISKRVNDSTFSKPVNLGYPLNTTANETSFYVTVDGKKAYFASDRDSVQGNYDIYEIKMPEQLQPQQIAFVRGYVFDSISKDRLNYASIYVRDAATGQDLYHFTSNRGDGSFMIALPLGKKYAFHSDRIGFLDAADTVALTGYKTGQEVRRNIALLPQDYQKPIVDTIIAVIYFPRNMASLSDSDKTVLQKAIEPWVGKDILVMVNGYTDNTGTPLINEQLSYTRAGLVSKEIQKIGVGSSAVRAHGWGEAEPIATNDTEEGRTQNRRVEVIVRW